jgi:UDP-2-acetamido-3-amino-2,3-dideoxy-glucuronate N-acetyltransferase
VRQLRVQIADGVEIGAEAIVGAGAVVTADVPPGATVRGAPAREATASGAGPEPDYDPVG